MLIIWIRQCAVKFDELVFTQLRLLKIATHYGTKGKMTSF
jgi:hypothetical protein